MRWTDLQDNSGLTIAALLIGRQTRQTDRRAFGPKCQPLRVAVRYARRSQAPGTEQRNAWIPWKVVRRMGLLCWRRLPF